VTRSELDQVLLGEYNKDLLNKNEINLLTKSDLFDSVELENIKKLLKKINRKTVVTSIYDKDSIERLSKLLS